MFSFESFLDISGYTMFAYDSRIATCRRSLESCMLSSWTFFLATSYGLLPLPYRCEIRFALGTLKWFWWWRNCWLLGNKINYMFQTHQIYELRIRRIRYKVHLRWWWFWRWYLQQSLFKLLSQSQLSSRLTLCWCLIIISWSLLQV